MEKAKVLLADDDRDILNTYSLLLGDDYSISTAKSVYEAKHKISNTEYDMAVLDLNFEGQSEDGIQLLDYIQEKHPEISVIVLSSDYNTKRVVEATRRPIVDFIAKGNDDEIHLKNAIKMAMLKKRLSEKSEIIFQSESPVMRDILKKVDRVLESDSQAPILILGESGTGKEYLAQYIATKLKKKIVAANMASIPKEIADSELFGHTKGSFTGAATNKEGLIEQASGGVFFLDEMGDCSLPIQAKLLRVIQEKEILPVGGLSPKKIELRFLAATHKNLEEMVHRNEFRLDLFQRISTFTFKIPPLRERPEDIEYYTRMFIKEFSKDEYFRIEQAGLEILKAQPWKGNVRELKNIIQRAVVFSKRRSLDRNTVLTALGKNNYHSGLLTKDRKIFTKDEVMSALEKARGNRTHAAEFLNVHVTTLHRWLKKFDLQFTIESTHGRPVFSKNISQEEKGDDHGQT